MARGKPVAIDLAEAHQLQAQGLSTAEIARRLRLPVSTLKDHLRRAPSAKTTEVYKSRPTNIHKNGAAEVSQGASTPVHLDLPSADMRELQEVLGWWRKRKHLLNVANATPAPTERWTVHVEKPFIERIKAEAEMEHVTVTEVINRIIRHYYQA